MKRFSEFISEGISRVVYHITNSISMSSIATYDMFKLTPMIDETGANVLDPSKIESGHWYYMSTARSTSSAYITDVAGVSGDIILVLDGEKLQTKYRGGPVNYYSQQNIKAAKEASFSSDRKYSEQEDRIYNKTPYIKQASRYIKEIRVDLSEWGQNIPKKILKNIISIAKYAKKYNIKMLYFNSTRDFLTGRNEIDIDINSYVGADDLGGWISPKKDQNLISQLYNFVYDLVYFNKVSDFTSDEAKEFVQNPPKNPSGYLLKKIVQLKKEVYIHTSPEDLLKMLRFLKVKSFSEMTDKIVAKWFKQ